MIQKRMLAGLWLVLVCSGVFAWDGQWISARDCNDASNSWILFSKTFEIGNLPAEKAIASIAADSKYWLWVNGEMVVYEGGLKRGPTPRDTYVDRVDLSPYMKRGENSINVLLWYFGKQGFSHNSSGKAGLFFECPVGNKLLVSDASWMSKVVRCLH